MSFWLFGKQPLSAELVTSVAAISGILLLGATVRRIAGELAAAAAVASLAVFPTLVAYEHSVLTEAGTFFFIAAIVYLMVAGKDAGPSWRNVAGLVAALAADITGARTYWS